MEVSIIYRIAIVDDEGTAIAALQDHLSRFEVETGRKFEIATFKNAIIFLSNYQPVYDVVFFDIQMPHMDGIEAAKRFRRIDTETLLVFVTNMADLALMGYQVQAFDFLVKPLSYDAIALKLKRIFDRLDVQIERKIIINSQGTQFCFPTREIYYMEVRNHQLIYHAATGDYSAYGTLGKIQRQLEGMNFFMCNNCYLINLQHVQKVYKYTVTVHGDELTISHPRRKAFLDALNEYIGG